MQWKIIHPQPPTDLAELTNLLLTNRGITNSSLFFEPTQPTQLTLSQVGIDQTQVDLVIQRLQTAIELQQKVIVFGDYDADGICATATLWLSLRAIGIEALPFIPDRIKHGYGLSGAAIKDILDQGRPDIVMTVDNGIVAHQAVAQLNQAGVDVIITDHHSPESELPAAMAIVHTTKLCGTSVAWMLSRELCLHFKKTTAVAESLLDLSGIATIADQVPLLDANRTFAFWGLRALQKTERPGIKSLCRAAKLDQAVLSTNGVHFGLAPRINAMGRLEHGLDALRLLCTQNQQRADTLAQSISLTNVRRQNLTEDLVAEALAQAESWKTEHLIIVHSVNFHEGVIGLIAGKLMETYFKPAIVIAEGEHKSKASARSIPGVNIVELIREVRDELLEVGGHPMAAGFGLENQNIQSVKTRLQLLAKTTITAEALLPSLRIESELPLSLVSIATVEKLNQFEPFGQGNPRPVWGLQNLMVLDAAPIGSQHQHLKLVVADTEPTRSSKPLVCLAWNYLKSHSPVVVGARVSIAGELEAKTWKDTTSVQLIVKDIILVDSR